MPYKLKKVKGGYKVGKKSSSKTYSKKPLSKAKAQAQMRAIYANTDESFENKLSVVLEQEMAPATKTVRLISCEIEFASGSSRPDSFLNDTIDFEGEAVFAVSPDIASKLQELSSSGQPLPKRFLHKLYSLLPSSITSSGVEITRWDWELRGDNLVIWPAAVEKADSFDYDNY